MSQRNFGQHRDNNEGGWNKVPDWGKLTVYTKVENLVTFS